MNDLIGKLVSRMREESFVVTVAAVFIFGLMLFMPFGVGRVIAMVVGLIVFLAVYLYTRELATSLLVLWLVLFPLNITFQMEFLSAYYDPFVKNILVNHLVPTLSVVDLLIWFSVLQLLGKYKNLIKQKTFYIPAFSLILLGGIHLAMHPQINTFVQLVRIIGIAVLFMGIRPKLRELTSEAQKNWVYAALIMVLATQLLIAFIQVKGATSLGLGFLGESQLIGGYVGSSFVEIGGSIFLRAYGTFPHPNVLAGFGLFAAIIGLLAARRNVWKELLVIILTFCIVFLTMSRSGVVALLIVSILWATRKYFGLLFEKLRNKRVTVQHAVGSLIYRDNSFAERAQLFSIGLDLLKNNLLFGVGAGESVRFLAQSEIPVNNGIPILQPVHNIFLNIFIEYGSLIGIVMLTFLISLIIKAFLNVQVKDSYLLVSVLGILLIEGNIDHYLVTLPQGLVILSGLLLVVVYYSARVTDS